MESKIYRISEYIAERYKPLELNTAYRSIADFVNGPKETGLSGTWLGYTVLLLSKEEDPLNCRLTATQALRLTEFFGLSSIEELYNDPSCLECRKLLKHIEVLKTRGIIK